MSEPNKICSKCCVEKPITEFYLRKDSIIGRQSKCRACSLAAHKMWYEKNKDKAAIISKNWYAKNRDRARAHSHANYVANKEQRKQQRQKQRKDHPERESIYKRRWRAKYPDKYKENNRRCGRRHGAKMRKGLLQVALIKFTQENHKTTHANNSQNTNS